MNTSTDDDLFADDDPIPEGLAPDHGWDNAVDVAEAKRMCREARGGFNRTERSKERIFQFAGRLRDLGISPVRLSSSQSMPRTSSTLNTEPDTLRRYRSHLGLALLPAPPATV